MLNETRTANTAPCFYEESRRNGSLGILGEISIFLTNFRTQPEKRRLGLTSYGIERRKIIYPVQLRIFKKSKKSTAGAQANIQAKYGSCGSNEQSYFLYG
jgi:hypothetical protein